MKKLLLVSSLLFLSSFSFADSQEDREIISDDNSNSLFIDSEDGSFDVSNYLSEAYGFLPFPTIITEPAVGFGATLGLLYLHDNFEGEKSTSGRNIPPSISGVLVAGTENGTKAAGLFHMGHWKEDNIRTTSVALYYDVNIDLYTSNNTQLSMNGYGTYFYQSVKFRILDSNLFWGANYTYGKTVTSLNNKESAQINLNDTTHLGSIALSVDYDSRDNVFSPDRGMLLSAEETFFNEAFGGDDNFEIYKLQGLFYQPLANDLFLDFKISFEGVSDDEAPFYMYPSINLRGVPLLRYQAQDTAVTEVQLRYEFTPRWSGLIFGGVGKAYGKDPFNPFIDTSFSDAKNRYTKGVGFRYMIARKYGLRMGIDIASSQEDEAIYLQFGTAWAGL